MYKNEGVKMIKLFDEDDNLLNLNKLFDEINSEHFEGRITKIPCVWNKRMTTTAGRIFYKTNPFTRKATSPTKIELSFKLFKNNGMDVDKITRTMQHEMTHAFLIEHFSEPGHTSNFQMIMTRITGEIKNHRCHSYDVTGIKKTQERKWKYTCSCGETVGYRARKPKAGAVYRARCCNGKVTFQNIGFDGGYDI